MIFSRKDLECRLKRRNFATLFSGRDVPNRMGTNCKTTFESTGNFEIQIKTA
jgi:hypothetical protein